MQKFLQIRSKTKKFSVFSSEPQILRQGGDTHQSDRITLSATKNQITPELAAELRVAPDFDRRDCFVSDCLSEAEVEAKLKFILPLTTVRVRRVSPDEFRQHYERAFLFSGAKFLNSLEAIKARAASIPAVPVNSFQISLFDASDQIGRFIFEMTSYADIHNASDIHLEPLESGCYIKMRINGDVLSHSGSFCDPATYTRIVQKLKLSANISPLAVDQVPLEGTVLFARDLSVRASFFPTLFGEKVVLRLLGKESNLEVNQLGLPSEVRDLLVACCEEVSGGLILIAGPTGSGKTTTLCSLLKHLKINHSICTIEDPVERVIPGVCQSQQMIERGITMSALLKGALRQDPDVIMLGELRDHASAELILQAAMTGHLVLASTHGSCSADVICRMEALGVSSATIRQGVKAILIQHLLPKLCTSCSCFDLLASQALGFEVLKEVGCGKCHFSGFSGRVLATELVLYRPSEIKFKIKHSLSNLLRRGEISTGTAIGLGFPLT